VIGNTIGSTIGNALRARGDPADADLVKFSDRELAEMAPGQVRTTDVPAGNQSEAPSLINFSLHGNFLNDAVFRTIDGIPVDQFGNALDIENLSVGYKTRFNIDILEEDQAGGHTYEFHVGKSDAFMLRRLSTPLASSPNGIQMFLTETSTFTSLASANRLVNATLSMKAYEVDDFLRGTDPTRFITGYFSSPTGRTMYSTAPVVSTNRSPGSFCNGDDLWRRGFYGEGSIST